MYIRTRTRSSLPALLTGLTLLLPGAAAASPLFGAYASVNTSANLINGVATGNNTSGPPNTPTPNGFLSASAGTSSNGDAGSASASGSANVGYVGGLVSVSGVNGCYGLFQQVCTSATAYSEFYDQFSIAGAPDGTPVSIQFTITGTGTIDGYGAVGYGATLADGAPGHTAGVSYTTGGVPMSFDNFAFLGQSSWTATYFVGTLYSLIGNQTVGAAERTCLPDCTSGSGLSADFSHTSFATATILTPGNFSLVSAGGYNYLNGGADPNLLAAPEPAPFALLIFAIVSIRWLRRRQLSPLH